MRVLMDVTPPNREHRANRQEHLGLVYNSLFYLSFFQNRHFLNKCRKYVVLVVHLHFLDDDGGICGISGVGEGMVDGLPTIHDCTLFSRTARRALMVVCLWSSGTSDDLAAVRDGDRRSILGQAPSSIAIPIVGSSGYRTRPTVPERSRPVGPDILDWDKTHQALIIRRDLRHLFIRNGMTFIHAPSRGAV